MEPREHFGSEFGIPVSGPPTTDFAMQLWIGVGKRFGPYQRRPLAAAVGGLVGGRPDGGQGRDGQASAPVQRCVVPCACIQLIRYP